MSTIRYRMYLGLLWFIALSLVGYHLFMAFFSLMPTTYWLEYHSVEPVKDVFKVNERLKFRSHTDLNNEVILSFNDILYCRDEHGALERYSEQTTRRLHTVIGNDHYTVWPYSPGVAYPTECCLESNINLHLPLHTDRHFRYDGCFEGKFFKVEE